MADLTPLIPNGSRLEAATDAAKTYAERAEAAEVKTDQDQQQTAQDRSTVASLASQVASNATKVSQDKQTVANNLATVNDKLTQATAKAAEATQSASSASASATAAQTALSDTQKVQSDVNSKKQAIDVIHQDIKNRQTNVAEINAAAKVTEQSIIQQKIAIEQIQSDVVQKRDEVNNVAATVSDLATQVTADKLATATSKKASEDAAALARQWATWEPSTALPSETNNAKYWAGRAEDASRSTLSGGGEFTPTEAMEYPDTEGVLRNTLWVYTFGNEDDFYEYQNGPLKGRIVSSGWQLYYYPDSNEFKIIPMSSSRYGAYKINGKLPNESGEVNIGMNDIPGSVSRDFLATTLEAYTLNTDFRLVNTREWTAATVSQAEAEAGVATTRRAWTSLLVRQATAAWWNTSAMKTKLDGIQEGAQVNTPTTSSRTSGSTTTVLQAKAMNDHRGSGDHDSRYLRLIGGTLTGRLTMPLATGQWVNGFTGGAAVTISTVGAVGSYSAWLTQRTPNHGWSVGTISDEFVIVNMAKADIDSNTNTSTKALAISPAGVLSGNGGGLTSLNASELTTGTIPTARLSGTYSISVSGSATTLATARQINGTNFNGSANITTALWGTARTLTIGNAAKSVNGSANVSWSLAEIGAVNKAGDTMTGSLSADTLGVTNNSATTGKGISLHGGATTGLPTYGLAFAGTETFGKHGAVQGDWATYFTTAHSNNRGWIFRYQTSNVASISALGHANFNGNVTASSFVGNASSATKLATARTISLLGDATGSTTFDGTGNANITVTINGDNHTHESIVVKDTRAADVTPNLLASNGVHSYFTNRGIGGLSSWHSVLAVKGWQDNYEMWELIGGSDSGGQRNYLYFRSGINTTFSAPQRVYMDNYHPNADTLTTARTVNGTSFNGSSNIVTSYWGTARTLTVGNTGKSVNGSGNVSWTLAEIGAQPANSKLSALVSSHVSANDQDFRIRDKRALVGTTTNLILNYAGDFTNVTVQSALHADSFHGPLTGNASSATKLATARTINGTSFNGTANITTANWGTARTITVGNTSKSVNGSGNVSWSLAEIGAVGEEAWYAKVKQGTWSAVAKFTHADMGGKAIVTFGHTRSSVVVNAMLLISWGHSNQGSIVQLQSHGYTQVAARLMGIDAETVVLEILDTASGTAGAENTYTVRVENLYGGLTKYTSFTASTGTQRGQTCNTQYNEILIDGKKVFHDGYRPKADTLTTARTINGTNFNGSANITTSLWGTARTLTLGNSAKSVNGSANVSWSLAEMGAVNKAGDTITGTLYMSTSTTQFRGVRNSNSVDSRFTDTEMGWAYTGTADFNVTAGLFPAVNNANGILSFNTHSGVHGHQLGFSSNGKLYHRVRGTSTWGELYTSTNKPSLAALGAAAASHSHSNYAQINTSSPTVGYLYLRRSDAANASLYVNQYGNGDIARFIAGNGNSTATGTNGGAKGQVTVKNDASVDLDAVSFHGNKARIEYNDVTDSIDFIF